MKKRYMNEYIFEFLFFFFLAERAIFFPWRVSNRIEKLWCIHLCFITLYIFAHEEKTKNYYSSLMDKSKRSIQERDDLTKEEEIEKKFETR